MLSASSEVRLTSIVPSAKTGAPTVTSASVAGAPFWVYVVASLTMMVRAKPCGPVIVIRLPTTDVTLPVSSANSMLILSAVVGALRARRMFIRSPTTNEAAVVAAWPSVKVVVGVIVYVVVWPSQRFTVTDVAVTAVTKPPSPIRGNRNCEFLELETSWWLKCAPGRPAADASPAALTINAIEMAAEPTARAAHFILFEYMVILPLLSFKMFSNRSKYCD